MELQVLLNNTRDQSYMITFTHDILSEVEDFIKENNIKKVLFLTEDTVWEFHGKDTFMNLKDLKDIECYKYIFTAGEENKNINTALEVISYLNNIRFNRNDLIICFGGGVVGDLGGFVSSIYKRGVRFLQIPTTLLSMLDSSVGGKTGVDYAGIKNIIGSFNQPKRVLINNGYLSTLPEIQLISGYFEGLKHALIDSEQHFLFFLSILKPLIRDNIVSHEILYNNIQIKAGVVMRDEEEKHERKKLNYGHTFGHAIESLSQYSLPHGVCVGYGIIYANILSHTLGYLDDELMQKINTPIKNILSQYPLKEFLFDDIESLMLNDKKNSSGKINFVLMKTIGTMMFIDVDKDSMKSAYSLFTHFIHDA